MRSLRKRRDGETGPKLIFEECPHLKDFYSKAEFRSANHKPLVFTTDTAKCSTEQFVKAEQQSIVMSQWELNDKHLGMLLKLTGLKKRLIFIEKKKDK